MDWIPADRRELVDAGQAVLAEADARLGEDDFDGACRCYLIAAWCFARAAHWPDVDLECRRCDENAYAWAWRAACTLLDNGSDDDPLPGR